MNRYALRQRVANMQDEPPDRAMEGTQVKRENIFLFVPNLIGKLGGVTTDNLILISSDTRIILAIISLYFMPLHSRRCSAIYTTSCLLDAFDGYFTRKLNQHTKFGAVLDMVTDRCTTTVYLYFWLPQYRDGQWLFNC